MSPKRRRLHAISLVSLIAGELLFSFGCRGSGDDDAADAATNASAESDTTAGESGESGGNEFVCNGSVAQIDLEVWAQGDSLPSEVFPDEADGVGILHVCFDDQSAGDFDAIDLSTPDKRFEQSFCVPPGMRVLSVILDEGEEDDPCSSSDFRDTCMETDAPCFRCAEVVAVAGEIVEFGAKLANTCD